MKPTEAFEKALKEIFDSLPHFLAVSTIEEKKEQFPTLIPPNKEKIAFEIRENLHSFQTSCHNGFKLILEELKKGPCSLPDFPSFEKRISHSFRTLLAPQPFTKAILKVVSGSSWRKSLDVSVDDVQIFYNGAKNLFDTGRFTDACDAFSFLSWFDATQHDFWMALGHSCFHIGAYERAINAYGIASSTLPEEPWPHIHAAACYEATGNFDQARDCLLEGRILEECKEMPDNKLISIIEIKMKDYEQGISTPIA